MKTFIKTITCIIACMFFTTTANAQHDKYFFTNLTGRAVISRTSGSTWLSLQQAQPVELKPGDMVNVEGDGRGELRFPDGTTARLKNNAMVTIMRYGINQRLGNVWLNVRRGSDIFKVITPLGSCSVLGTSFDVDVDRYGQAKIRVFLGLVAVRAAEDSRNRQLVLQPGMRTSITEKTRVADKPEKFNGSTIEAQLNSEWEPRNFSSGNTPPALLPAAEPDIPPALQPAVATPVKNSAANGQKPVIKTSPRVISQNERIQPPPPGPITNVGLPADSNLPPIRPELQTGIELPSAGDVIAGVESSTPKDGNILVIPRQRSAFLEMLRQQQIDRDSTIGGGFTAKNEMVEDQHGQELGQASRLTNNISDNESLDREFWLLRNRLLRVQSQIRQKELEIEALIKENVSTPTQQRKISSNQQLLGGLQSEQRVLVNRLRDVQTKKR